MKILFKFEGVLSIVNFPAGCGTIDVFADDADDDLYSVMVFYEEEDAPDWEIFAGTREQCNAVVRKMFDAIMRGDPGFDATSAANEFNSEANGAVM